MTDEEDDGYDYADAQPGIQDAVERARAKKKQDEAPAGKHPLAAAFEKVALGASPDSPKYGPVEPPPPEPPSVAPPPEGPPDSFNDFPTSRPAAPSKYDEAMANVTRIAGEQTPGIDTDALERSQAQQRERNGKNDFTRALQSWLLRKPFEPTADTTADDALKVQGIKSQQAEKDKSTRLSAAEMVAKALRGEKSTGSLSEYQKYEMDRNARLDTEKKAAAEAKAKESEDQLKKDRVDMGRELGVDLSNASQKDIDRMRELRHDKVTEGLTAAGQQEHKGENIDRQAQDLAKALGDPTVFETQWKRLQQLTSENGGKVPGIGKMEALSQDTPAAALKLSSDRSVEGRKLVKQMAANYVRSITGAGVSDAERAMLNSAMADANSSDDRQVMIGLKSLKMMYDAKVKSTKAGYRPEAVKRIEAAVPSSMPEEPKDPNSWVTLRRKNGDSLKAKRADADALVRDHPDEITIEEE